MNESPRHGNVRGGFSLALRLARAEGDAVMRSLIQRHPIASFYALTFAISWGGLLVLVGAGGIPGSPEQVASSMPVVLLALFAGPSLSGLLMTGVVSGRSGLRDHVRRLLRWRVGSRWYAVALLLGPLLVAAVLLGLSQLSSEYVPGILTADHKLALVLFGISWGLLGGGLLEELGWTGFATPRLRTRHGAVATGLIVGLLWGAWHFLIAFWSSRGLSGETSLANFVAGFLIFYVGALPAFRVLMVWVYDRTESLSLAMLMHASLSSSTLILQPQATGVAYWTWNLVLVAALWTVVAATLVIRHRLHSGRSPRQRAA